MNSGIATMSRELVMGTVHKYDFASIAGAIKHPEAGKVIDLNDAVRKETGVADAYVRLYPTDGYGNDQIIFQIMEIEKPDAILFFTDPRYWAWLFAIENQIRKTIPMTYLQIWDSNPYPMWNRPSYQSCDALFSISKQTHNLVEHVLGSENCLKLGSE